MSDYIYKNGEPIIAGKLKDQPPGFVNPKLYIIQNKLLSDKMKYQDIPMLLIMTIQFFASFGEGTKQIEMIVSLIQIATTVLSIISAKISLSFTENVKGIDFKKFCDKMIEREADIERRRVEALKEKEKAAKDKNTGKKGSKKEPLPIKEDKSSSETEESQQSGFANVMYELEMLDLDNSKKESMSRTIPVEQD